MIRTYLLNKNELEKIKYSQDIISESRRAKTQKMKREDDKQLSECAELLLIYALKEQFPEASLPLKISEDEKGKPYLAGLPFYFNMSHSKDYAVCSLSDEPVGTDIECFRVREVLHADKILHPEEAHLLGFISSSNEKKKFFYECWVAKESYLKNLGIGLIVRPSDFLVNEDRLMIRLQEIGDPKDPRKNPEITARSLSGKATPFSAKEAAPSVGSKDTTLSDNLSYLQKRYVHVFEPGEIRGSDWKFDANYRMAVCSMRKDPDSIAKILRAEDIDSVL